ncbi:hypothetical protein ACFXAZ_33340 [Streptomyces sp. NPDC059477]|uniref:hypothetical protein n=1 Tax=Streptomyces sp. NPDC059477 TaxID=3346847 RepID=UPI0036A81E8E
MSRSEPMALDRIETNGYRPLEPYPGKVNIRWLMECTECGEPQRLRPDHKMKPCEHKARERQQRDEAAADKAYRDWLVSLRTPKLATKNLRALEPHPGEEGVRWWVECKFCGRQWHMLEDKLRACPHKGTGDEGAPTPPASTAPKRRSKTSDTAPVDVQRFLGPLDRLHPAPETARTAGADDGE